MFKLINIILSILFVLLFTIGGCVKDYRPVVDGTYLAPSGEEWISVQESKIHFYVKIDESDKFFDRAFDNYTVWSDGSINPYTMASAEAAFLIGKFIWYWDGEKIIQRDRKTDEPIKVFSLKPSN